MDIKKLKELLAKGENTDNNGNFYGGNMYTRKAEDSSAVGKYQFVQSVWGDKIKSFAEEKGYKYSGIDDFLNNSILQERFTDNYIRTELTPLMESLKVKYKPTNISDEQLAAMLHYAGYGNLQKALENNDFDSKINTISPNEYLKRAGLPVIKAPTKTTIPPTASSTQIINTAVVDNTKVVTPPKIPLSIGTPMFQNGGQIDPKTKNPLNFDWANKPTSTNVVPLKPEVIPTYGDYPISEVTVNAGKYSNWDNMTPQEKLMLKSTNESNPIHRALVMKAQGKKAGNYADEVRDAVDLALLEPWKEATGFNAANRIYNKGLKQTGIDILKTTEDIILGSSPFSGNNNLVPNAEFDGLQSVLDVAELAPYGGGVLKLGQKGIQKAGQKIIGKGSFALDNLDNVGTQALGKVDNKITSSVDDVGESVTNNSNELPPPPHEIILDEHTISLERLSSKNKKKKVSFDDSDLGSGLTLRNNPSRVENVENILGKNRSIKTVINKETGESIDLKTWKDEGGNLYYYISANMPSSKIKAGKAYIEIEKHIPKGASLLENSSLSYDSFLNILKQTKNPKFEKFVKGSVPMNNSAKNTTFKIKPRESAPLVEFANKNHADDAVNELNLLLDKYDLPKATVINEYGNYSIQLPNIGLKKLYSIIGVGGTGAAIQQSNFNVQPQKYKNGGQPFQMDAQGNVFQDGGIQKMGYKDNSPHKENSFIDINSNNITMGNVKKFLLSIPDQGEPKILKPESGTHIFPEASKVREIPLPLKIKLTL